MYTGAGKSTFFKEHFFQTHVRISLDLLRTRHREKVFLAACLKTGEKTVTERRQIYVDMELPMKEEYESFLFDMLTR